MGQQDASVEDERARRSTLFTARLLTALVQAASLYLLAESAAPPKSWPATEPRLFEPLLLVFSYVPLLVLFGLGQLRPRILAIAVVLATIVIAGLGYHDVARGRAVTASFSLSLPWFRFWLALSVGLFIGLVLVIDSTTERRLMPSYPRHFDTAWKLGIQAVLATVFVGVFWGILYLGSGLFGLVKIGWFGKLIAKHWFAFPATTLAIALSIHVTDVQPALIRGVRFLALTLFSWLLPVFATILLVFLGSLPFISLTPLWNTHFAAALLLLAAGLIVFLVNCAYQDGAAIATPPRIKRLTGTLGSIELVPLVGLAVWALGLRVQQYGWTVERILAAAIVVVAACYALGYAAAAVGRSPWLKRLEATNFLVAYVVLALILMLFSPLADPARLMVIDQVARLKSGAIPVEKFDFAALKFDGARWGTAALTELSQVQDLPNATTINADARRALAMVNRYAMLATADYAAHIKVYPADRKLPASFYDSSAGPLAGSAPPQCVRSQKLPCLARFVPLGAAGAEAILFLDSFVGFVFEQDATGQWRKTAQLTAGLYCEAFRQAVEAGDFQLAPHAWPDLVVGDQHVSVQPSVPYACRPVAAPKHP